MKKITLLALIAIMLIGMLAFAACKAKTEEVPADTTAVEATDTEAVIDTAAVVEDAVKAEEAAKVPVKK